MNPVKHTEAKKSGCQFPKNIFKCIFSNENIYILIAIPLKFVPKGPINNIPAVSGNGLAPNRQQAIIWNNDG